MSDDKSTFHTAEANRRSSESYFRVLDHASPVGIFWTDAEGGCIHVNDRWSEITGLPEKEALGEGWTRALHPEDEHAVFESWNHAVTQDQPFKGEYRFQRPDGQVVWVLGQAVVEKDTQGRILGYVGTITDVSELKKVQQELQLKEAAINSSLNAIAMADMDGTLTYVNASFLKMWGLPRAQVAVGRHALEFWDEPDKADAIMQGLLQCGVIESELVGKRSDASRFVVRLTAHVVRDGMERPVCMMASFVDVTKQRLAERQLVKERNFKSKILDAAGALIVVLDNEGRIETFNAECERVTGYKSEDVLGKQVWEIFFDPEVQEDARTVFDTLKHTDGSSRYENAWTTRTGEKRIISWANTTITDDDGLVSHVIAIGVDITQRRNAEKELLQYRENLEELVKARTYELEKTVARVELENTERKKAEASLLRAKEEAELANRLKSEFLGRMSHELRTPMNAILGFGQLLEGESLSEEQESYVDEVLRAGRHLLVLIDEVLNLSRIESGRIEIEMEDVQLLDVVRDAVALVVQQALEKGISIISDTCDEMVFVKADYERLKEILVNLLTNAVKYNRPNGSVTISCKAVSGNRLRVAVRDTGSGIPVEKQILVFEPFNRLGAEFSDIPGTGIGLTIARQLVEKMGGEIGLESIEGQGSTFWVELDSIQFLANPDASAQLDDSNQDGKDGVRAGFVVLYIEDDAGNMRLVRRIMEREEGVVLLEAGDGEQGLLQVRQYHPDLIILDINLPGMDGYEILEHLKNDIDTAVIPVIALSAAAMPADVERGLLAGFRRYLTKPIDVKVLRKAVAEFRHAEEPKHTG